MKRAVAAMVVLVALLTPALAVAHGGILLASVQAGPYRVDVTAAPLKIAGRPPAIDVTSYVSADGRPVQDARVRLTVLAEGRTVHPRVREIAGGYEGIVPVDDADTVGQQTIMVDIGGSAGTGHVVVRPSASRSSRAPVGFLIATSLVLAAVLVWAVRRRNRRLLADGADVPRPGDRRAPDPDAAPAP